MLFSLFESGAPGAVRGCCVVEGRRSSVDLVTPGFSHRSDQRLKVEIMCTLQQVYSRFQFNLLLNCPLCSYSTHRPTAYILMPIRSVRLTAKREIAGRRATLSHPCPSVAPETAQHIGRKGEVYTTTV